jgi:hypothetical protein
MIFEWTLVINKTTTAIDESNLRNRNSYRSVPLI